MDKWREPRMVPKVYSWSGDEVDDRAVDVEAAQRALSDRTHIVHTADPPVYVVGELSASAIRVERRNKVRVGIEPDKMITEESFRHGKVRRSRHQSGQWESGNDRNKPSHLLPLSPVCKYWELTPVI